ncbi:hypothetical protein, partial [Streptomyces werraensis]|uniref:hypothetical protein n=1 Tax=Streptomyces werraensis TaxID=68284 RepID=UPI00343F874B
MIAHLVAIDALSERNELFTGSYDQREPEKHNLDRHRTSSDSAASEEFVAIGAEIGVILLLLMLGLEYTASDLVS